MCVVIYRCCWLLQQSWYASYCPQIWNECDFIQSYEVHGVVRYVVNDEPSNLFNAKFFIRGRKYLLYSYLYRCDPLSGLGLWHLRELIHHQWRGFMWISPHMCKVVSFRFDSIKPIWGLWPIFDAISRVISSRDCCVFIFLMDGFVNTPQILC